MAKGEVNFGDGIVSKKKKDRCLSCRVLIQKGGEKRAMSSNGQTEERAATADWILTWRITIGPRWGWRASDNLTTADLIFFWAGNTQLRSFVM